MILTFVMVLDICCLYVVINRVSMCIEVLAPLFLVLVIRKSDP